MRIVWALVLALPVVGLVAGCGKSNILPKSEAPKTEDSARRIRQLEDRMAALEKQLEGIQKSFEAAQSRGRDNGSLASAEGSTRPAPKRTTARRAAPAPGNPAGRTTQPGKVAKPKVAPARPASAKPRAA
jgi:outer membrane murein-binding lipoprotein Lpp